MRDQRLAFFAALAAVAALGVGCANSTRQPLPVSPIRPAAGDQLQIRRSFVIVDASGSVAKDFPDEKALVQSFVAAMPEGNYEAGAVAFGGEDRISVPVRRFDRAQLGHGVQQIRHLDESTPLAAVLAEAGQVLSGSHGRSAIVIFSDGEPTTATGADTEPTGALQAARDLKRTLKDQVCFHTVEIGAGSSGGTLLRQIAALTPCGSFRTARDSYTVAGVERLGRAVFYGNELPAVGAAADADRDGIRDAIDRCPGTPRGASVDPRGCWVIPDSRFGFDSAEVTADLDPTLREIGQVLEDNPELRLRVEGHTDSTGPDSYNVDLSRRRAESVLQRLTEAGLDAGRLEASGIGEAKPAVPNDSQAHRRLNRRVELRPIR